MSTKTYLSQVKKLATGGLPMPKVGTGDTEVGDGTTAITQGDTAAGALIAEVFTGRTGSPPTITEDWVIRDVNAWQTSTLTLKLVGNATTLSPARREALLAEDGSGEFRRMTLTFQYSPMPSAEAVNALPTTNPSGVSGRSYALRTIAGAEAAGTSDGRLFRESISNLVNGKLVTWYTEHWVLYDTYAEPAGDVVVRITPETVKAPSTLRAFLLAARTRYEGQTALQQAAWRYVQVQFQLGAV